MIRLLLCGLAGALMLPAQSISANVVGTVVDSQGLPVSKAQVKVISKTTNAEARAESCRQDERARHGVASALASMDQKRRSTTAPIARS